MLHGENLPTFSHRLGRGRENDSDPLRHHLNLALSGDLTDGNGRRWVPVLWYKDRRIPLMIDCRVIGLGDGGIEILLGFLLGE